MKKFLSLLFVLIVFQTYSQRILTQFPKVNGAVYAVAVDSVSQTIFIGGDLQNVNGVARIAIAAIDYNTGALKSFNPNITPVANTESITDLLVAGDTLYACGNFNSVQGSSRQYVCAFRISTGALLPFNANFNTWPFEMQMHRNKLFYRGTFSQGGYYSFACVNRNTGAHYNYHLIGASNMSSGRVYSFDVRNDKIYALCNVINYFNPYNSFLGTFDINTGVLLDSVNCPFDEFNYFLKTRSVVNGNKNIFVATIDSVYYQKPGRVASFDTLLNLNTFCNSSFTSGTPYNNGPNSLFSWDNILFALGGPFVKWGNYSNIPNFAAISELSNEVIWTPNPKGNFGLNDFKVINNRLYLLGIFDTLENFACKNFAVYDIRGLSTDSLINGADSVCRQSLFNNYTIPLPTNLSYNWNYSGTVFTKFQNMNAGSFHFYYNTTPGNVTCTINGSCTMDGPGFAQKPISFYQVPYVNAGADTTLNCAANQLPLQATITSGNTLQWTFPGGANSGLNPITVNTSGQYIAKTTSLKGCNNFDTVQVFVDTIKPIINNLNAQYQLQCQPNYIQVYGQSNNANDSLWWQSSIQNYIPNPITVSLNGNYIFYAQNLSNHCVQTDTILVNAPSQFPLLVLPPVNDTLSCIKDSLYFNVNHLNHEKVSWVHINSGTILQNPLLATQMGIYNAIITDTISQCTSQGSINVLQNLSQSAISIQNNAPEINCSNDSIILSATALINGTQLYWSDTLQQIYSNPAPINHGGTFYITSVHPGSGCERTDSVFVNKTNKIEIKHSNDTLVCKGASITLTSEAIGNFNNPSYYWNQIAGSYNYQHLANNTTYVTIAVSDNSGCFGKDSIKVSVALVLQSDSIQSIQPCDTQNPNGQINWFVSGGVPPLQFSLNGGSTQSNAVFNQLNFGNYQLMVIDSLGCSLSKTAEITTSSNMPNAEFLVSTQQFVKDTFALIDLTQPQADSVKWIFPSGTIVINNDLFNPIIVNNDTGSFVIQLKAYIGNCILNKTKTIYVHETDTTFANLVNQNGIKNFSISPNPNNGNFNFQFEFYKKQLASLVLYDANSNIIYKQNFTNVLSAGNNIQITSEQSGSYYLYLIGEFDTKGIVVIVTE